MTNKVVQNVVPCLELTECYDKLTLKDVYRCIGIQHKHSLDGKKLDKLLSEVMQLVWRENKQKWI